MKHTKSIEKLINKFYVHKKAVTKTTTELDRRIMDNAILAHEKSRKTQPAIQSNLWRIIMKSRIAKFAMASVIAIALLVPISYGTSNIIKKLMTGSVEVDDYQADFALGRDVRVELEIGTKEQQNIVSARNINFFTEDGELKGTLRCRVRCLPKYKWMTTIELLDVQDKKLASTQHVNENTGVEISYMNSSPRDIHFTLGKWSKVSQAYKFKVGIKKVSENTKTTPDAWIESSELDIVHGRVTGPDGKPVANAVVQIREKRKPGQIGIMAPDVITDKQGFYSYDSIKWPYYVGVTVYEGNPSDSEYLHQFKRLNRVLEGNQTVDFEFGNFPTGSSAIFGKVESPTGQAINEFSIDIRLQVDFEDYSSEYLYRFGLKKPFTTEDSKYEILGLPAGKYDITIYPNQNVVPRMNDFLRRMSYTCELQEGQSTEIGAGNIREKIFYGRVLFEDGTPAVSDLEGFETQIIAWGHDYTAGVTTATVDKNGYFATLMTDEAMEQFKSGQTWLKVSLTKPEYIHRVLKGEKFPVELLSLERDKAGVLKIKRPDIYYGRVLYENGKPAVPEVLPWSGAKVWTVLRCTPATSKTGGTTEHLCELDKDGYFSIYLDDEQIKQIKEGNYLIQIYHPSYEQIRASFPIINYPFEMLSTKKNNVKGYKLSSDAIMAPELRDIDNILESIEKLKELFVALKSYTNEHQGNYPGTMGLLDLKSDDFQWLFENVEYLEGRIDKTFDLGQTALAYDKALLEKYGSTFVLFGDGHIEYCQPRRLEILGISK